MGKEVKVLDHGYVRLVETWGSDQRIIESARMSTQKGFEGWGPRCKACKSTYWVVERAGETTYCDTSNPLNDASVLASLEKEYGRKPACSECGGNEREPGDEKLLRYLWKNAHATPFEMAGATFEVQAPIFVFREWHRHRVPFGYNEASARYAPLPDLNYLPTVERLRQMGEDDLVTELRRIANEIERGENFESYLPTVERVLAGGGHLTKQAAAGDGAEALTVEGAEKFLRDLAETYDACEETYQDALKRGVPKELARLVLPVGRYSKMRVTANLRGWFGLLQLRLPKNVQWEFRQYAESIRSYLREEFPRSTTLFDEGFEASQAAK